MDTLIYLISLISLYIQISVTVFCYKMYKKTSLKCCLFFCIAMLLISTERFSASVISFLESNHIPLPFLLFIDQAILPLCITSCIGLGIWSFNNTIKNIPIRNEVILTKIINSDDLKKGTS